MATLGLKLTSFGILFFAAVGGGRGKVGAAFDRVKKTVMPKRGWEAHCPGRVFVVSILFICVMDQFVPFMARYGAKMWSAAHADVAVSGEHNTVQDDST